MRWSMTILLAATMMFTTRPLVAQTCGNGTIDFDLGETCDDGNTREGDGCPATCNIASCTPGSTCTGDCGSDGDVTVDEIITGVNIALGTAQLTMCGAFDGNADQQVTVDEILTAVNNALNGCSGAILDADVAIAVPNGVELAAVTVFVRYPDGVVRVPGFGNDAQVQASVLNLDPAISPTFNDLDYALRTVAFTPDLSPIAAGRLLTIRFDRCAGAPRPSSIPCVVEDAADVSLESVSGVTCAVSF